MSASSFHPPAQCPSSAKASSRISAHPLSIKEHTASSWSQKGRPHDRPNGELSTRQPPPCRAGARAIVATRVSRAFGQASVEVSVDPIVKLVGERERDIGPSSPGNSSNAIRKSSSSSAASSGRSAGATGVGFGVVDIGTGEIAVGTNARVAPGPFRSAPRLSVPVAIASATQRRPAASKPRGKPGGRILVVSRRLCAERTLCAPQATVSRHTGCRIRTFAAGTRWHAFHSIVALATHIPLPHTRACAR